MTTREAAILLPVYGDFCGNVHRNEDSWVQLLTRRGLMMCLNIFRSSSDYSGCIAAAPGSGKSFLLQYMIFCLHVCGVEVILLDNGRSGEKLIKSLGGEFYKLAIDSPDVPNLNPFFNLTETSFNDLFEGIVDLHMLLCFENEQPIPGSRIAMQEAVRAAWNKERDQSDPRLVLECLEIIVNNSIRSDHRTDVQDSAGSLVPRLKAFLDSPKRGRFFDGSGTLDPQSILLGFELGGLSGDKHLQRVVNFFLANMLMSRPRKIKGGKKVIFIDEAKDVMEDEVSAKAVEALVLKGRKDKTAVWPIFQSLLRAWEQPAGKIVLNMANWKIILGQNSEELQAIFDNKVLVNFADDPYFRKQVQTLTTVKGEGGYSEALIVCREWYEVGRLYVDPFMHALFSSEDDARDAVLDLIDSGVPAVEAVCTVMNDHAITRKNFIRDFLDTLTQHHGVPKSALLSEIKEVLNA